MTRRNRWTNLVRPQVREPIRAQVTIDGVGELYIYDLIDEYGGEYGVNAAEVSAALAELGDVRAISIRLNSPGGDYFQGVPIAHALARHPASVTVHVDGLAASAASVIAMGGDRIVMGQGSQMMIHEARSMAWGTATEVRRTADMLDQTNDDIAGLYANRTGGDVTAWRAKVAEETWYTAAQAVAAGLADEVVQLPQRAPDDAMPVARTDIRTTDVSSTEATPEPPAPPAAAPPAALPTAGVDLAELIRSAARDRTTA
jgi:ATP-dependent protease ClpP protease subunit